MLCARVLTPLMLQGVGFFQRDQLVPIDARNAEDIERAEQAGHVVIVGDAEPSVPAAPSSQDRRNDFDAPIFLKAEAVRTRALELAVAAFEEQARAELVQREEQRRSRARERAQGALDRLREKPKTAAAQLRAEAERLMKEAKAAERRASKVAEPTEDERALYDAKRSLAAALPEADRFLTSEGTVLARNDQIARVRALVKEAQAALAAGEHGRVQELIPEIRAALVVAPVVGAVGGSAI